MTYFEVYSSTGVVAERLDRSGLWSGSPLAKVRDATPAELAGMDDEDAVSAVATAAQTARSALQDALALAPLYPAPSPEETALIDSQVSAALALFRDLTDPPADVVALAAAVVSWRAEIV